MFCRKCGKEIPDDSEFCPKCGTRNVIENVIEVETSGVDLSKKPVSHNNALVVANTAPVCSECGIKLNAVWQFCPNCGEDNLQYNFSDEENPKNTGLRCPECGKSVLTKWRFCPYCGENNAHYKNAPKPKQPTAPPPVVVVQPPPQPQPQVIIKEVIREEKKTEEKGCGTMIGEAIGGFLTVCFFIGLLGSCFSCTG